MFDVSNTRRLTVIESNLKSNKPKNEKCKTSGNCYKLSIFINELAVEAYKCLICQNVCNTPVELTCAIHEEEDDEFNTLIVGKQCLLNYLGNNNNKCPIKNHNNCEYGNNLFVNRQLLKQKVKCVNNKNNIKNNLFTNNDEMKTTVGETKGDCTWIGSLKKLENHLKECKSIKCLFSFNDTIFCSEKIINNDVKLHNETYASKHMELMRQYIISQNSVNKTKDKQITDLSKRVKQLETELDFLKKMLSPPMLSPHKHTVHSSVTPLSKTPEPTKNIYIGEFSNEFKGKKVSINKKNPLNVTGRKGQSIRFNDPLNNGMINQFSVLLNKIGESYIIGIVCGDYLTVKDYNYEPYGIKDKRNNNWNKSNVICISSDNDTCINGKWTTKQWNEQLYTNDICTFEVNLSDKNNRFISVYVNGKLRNGNDRIVISNNSKNENWYPFISFFNNRDNITILQGN